MSGAEGALSLGIRCEQQGIDGKGERKGSGGAGGVDRLQGKTRWQAGHT